jgi:hypothetical protein
MFYPLWVRESKNLRDRPIIEKKARREAPSRVERDSIAALNAPTHKRN